jgi:hypothetical protein
LELVCIEGAVPGRVVATLAHEARIKLIAMQIANHPAGGWHIASPDGAFGPRCHSVTAAILMEASEAYVDA